MSIEERINLVQRKIWTVEELLLQLDPIVEDVDRLSSAHRKGIPVFANDWSEAGVRKYIKDIEKAVHEPIKYMNRNKLEEIGLRTEGISDDILADTRGIGEILNMYREVQGIDDIGKKPIAESLLMKWLTEGIENTRIKLQEINDAISAFKRLTESGIDDTLKSDLTREALEDITTLSKCEEVISKFTYLSDFEINLGYKDSLEEFCGNIDTVWSIIQQIQEKFGVSREQIICVTRNKNLSKLVDILNSQYLEYFKEKGSLIEECNMYSLTLCSMDEGVPELPESLVELRKTVEDLRNRCLELLGKSGLAFINYIKEGGDFPKDIGLGDIQRTIELLRPFFLRILSAKES